MVRENQPYPMDLYQPAVKSFLCAALIFVIIFLFYNHHQKVGFIYDDQPIIVEHPAFRTIDDVVRIFGERHYPNLPYYRPLVRFTLLLQKTLHGDNAGLFYLVNVILMGMTGVALFLLFSSAPFRFPLLLSSGLALLISLHPAASSCVYPISSGRETLLPAFFIICALIAYGRDGLIWFVAAVLFFTCALFSKESSVVLVFVFMAVDYFRKRFGRKSRRYVLGRYAVFVPVYAGYFLMRYRLFAGSEFEWRESLKYPVMSILYTFQTTLFPFVELKYEPGSMTWFSPLRTGGVVLIILLMSALSLAVFRDVRRWLAMLGAMFILFVLPTSNLVLQETMFDERYVFLPLVPFCAYSAILARRYCGNLIWRQWGAALAMTSVILVFAWISMGRGGYFTDREAFFLQWVKTAPNRSSALNGYANLLQRRGAYDQAERVYQRAIALDPDFEVLYYNLGLLYLKEENFERAAQRFRRTLALNPRFEKAWYHLGVAYELMGIHTRAADCYRRELSLYPENRNARLNLDRLYHGKALSPLEKND